MKYEMQYANVILKSAVIIDLFAPETTDNDIKNDYFEQTVCNNNDSSVQAFWINYQNKNIGYVALYNIDFVNQYANIYGKIYSLRHYGELIKALLELQKYAFTELNLRKLSFVYRQDNYLFDDVCKHLGFVREGLLREQLKCENSYVDLNTYGMLHYEYHRLACSLYKRMFSWDYNFKPHNIEFLDLSMAFNRRLFTNLLDNPNMARINDWLGEYVLNDVQPENDYLIYNGIKFSVNIFDHDSPYDCFSCQQQEFTVTKGRFDYLLLIATAQFGNKCTYIKAVYEDGSIEECSFTIGDWCDRIANDQHVIYCAKACRNLGYKANMIKGDAFIYLQRVRLNPNKDLCKLVFPNEQDIFVFAGGLC